MREEKLVYEYSMRWQDVRSFLEPFKDYFYGGGTLHLKIDGVETPINTGDIIYRVGKRVWVVKGAESLEKEKEKEIQKAMEWYANERGIGIDEFDDYDAHVCRVAASYHLNETKL